MVLSWPSDMWFQTISLSIFPFNILISFPEPAFYEQPFFVLHSGRFHTIYRYSDPSQIQHTPHASQNQSWTMSFKADISYVRTRIYPNFYKPYHTNRIKGGPVQIPVCMFYFEFWFCTPSTSALRWLSCYAFFSHHHKLFVAGWLPGSIWTPSSPTYAEGFP